MKKYKIGYTQGVFDMFHIGHLNLINHAKEFCDHLIVGVNSDELVEKYKHKKPVINETERAEIVSNIKAVDECVISDTLDKEIAFERYHFDAIFIGDDWKGNPRWKQTEIDMAKHGADLIYLPHTYGISSTVLRPEESNKINDNEETNE